ncbi:DNA-methyltransferase [Rhizorhabdus wittichii]|uniref:DNA-methyltransferase n=1 Tax=Rhizorhabdus wittichii TaxID=160791 RepID=UPI001D01695A|nr:site-specific DNA-methyltransferase [Rhizorhabdus wittichii]
MDDLVDIRLGDVFEQLAKLPSNSVDCIVFSPPYWGLRDYGVAGQIGLEPTLGEHLDVMVRVCRELRRVLKVHGTMWLNYGDCYAAAPNGKSAAAYKADGTDDRTFRDKPFSTVGPIQGRTYYGAERGSRGVDRDFHDHMRAKAGPILQPDARGPQRDGAKEAYRADSGFTVRPGGYLKPKDLCMIPNRLAIALQDDGWYVRSEIIWHKPNPMPESVYDRPTTAHEKVWLLTKSEDYFYNDEAIREPVAGGAHARRPGPNSRQNVDRVPVSKKSTGVGWGHQDRVNPKEGDRGRDRIVSSKRNPVPAGWDTDPGTHGNVHRNGRRSSKTAAAGSGIRNNESFSAAVADIVSETRNARNVWTIAPKAFREAHFATFPPELARRCIAAGTPATVCGCCGAPEGCGPICEQFERVPGLVLDPFGGAGTVGLVAREMGLRSILIELNPEYAEISHRRIYGPACGPIFGRSFASIDPLQVAA